ncbi:peptide ABC transporter permease [Blautia sp. An249]|uniref:ABC transporter permease n=1 Tax=Blautia sp. An249 TaxID=1965603 RepID=UPI000B37BD47|nr:ABC transporter permease [Blautia sp. An249]OUO80723.1 peptide ABC transporter permease [Blautia sp. An249]
MKYMMKKTGTLIITLLIVSFLSFLAFNVIPGDAARSKLGTEATQEQVEALQTEMGLNEPILVQYGRWLRDFVTGDLGESFSYSMPVWELLRDKIPITAALTAISFFLILLLSVPLGIFTAQREGKWPDRALMVLDQIAMSVPGFFWGILITLLFGLILKWFTPGAYVPITESFGGFLSYLIAPGAAIALPRCAMGVKILRSSVLAQMEKDYVRTAYARGNGRRRVMYRHVLKNALLPVLTFWGMTIADIVANSIIIEQVFTIPGMGSLLITSISNRDYPVALGIIVLIAFFVIAVNFLVDILYGRIDPRIRVEQ